MSTLKDCEVERASKFEDAEFKVLNIFIAQGQLDIERIRYVGVLLVLLGRGLINEMEIIVLCQVVLWYQIASVPVQGDVIHEFMILIAKEEPVLPVLLIFIDDLLLNFTRERNQT